MQIIDERINEYCATFEKRLMLQRVYIPPNGLIAGCPVPEKLIPFYDPAVYIGWDNSHFPFPYQFVIEQGISGIIKRAQAPAEGLKQEETALRKGIAKTYSLLKEHIEKHILLVRKLQKTEPGNGRLKCIELNLLQICSGKPETFEQGIQLFWFLWRARQYSHPSSIGRMDVFLNNLYVKSVKNKNERENALQLVCELWEKLNKAGSGDTLMNIMLGGVDRDGKDISSDLSVLLMEATMITAKSEPHINVRMHENSPEEFKKTAYKMVAMGQGQGVLYNDEFIVPSLVSHGVPLELARLYANDGCTEITIDGKSGIQFWQFEMVKTFELCLFRGSENPIRPNKKIHKWTHTRPAEYYKSQLKLGYDSGNPSEAKTYDEFEKMFLNQLSYQMDLFFEKIDEKICEDKETCTTISSLLLCGALENSIDKGKDPLRGGFEVDNYQLLSGSVPTTADCLAAVETVVFKEKFCTMQELINAVSQNFKGFDSLREKLLSAPKFGNDNDSADLIAARLAEWFLSYVDNHKAPHNIKIWPGLYNIDFMMFASVLGATPDGRFSGDLICDHFSPTPGRAKKGPTSVLRSASKAKLSCGCAASPVYITLPAGPDIASPETVKSLVDGIRRLNLPLVSIAVNDKEKLKKAMENPEQYEDLIVRVWGYNARFIDLDSSLQKHIIERTL